MKRFFDVVASGIGLILLSPLFIILTIWIKCDSTGSVFYRQIRVGRNNRDFQLLKFRSMRVGSDKKGLITVGGRDPRITRSGYYIRKYKLDEFPQLINVLKGDMSLVGTRPPTEDEWVKYELHHRSRLAIKPGITGMWQVSGRSEITDFEQVVALDRSYIANWSLELDVKILCKTVGVVLRHEGAM